MICRMKNAGKKGTEAEAEAEAEGRKGEAMGWLWLSGINETLISSRSCRARQPPPQLIWPRVSSPPAQQLASVPRHAPRHIPPPNKQLPATMKAGTYVKMAGAFAVCCIGGPLIVYAVQPDPDELFKACAAPAQRVSLR